MREVLALLRRFAGIRSDRAGYLEMLLSTVGGLVGLIGVMLISKAQLGAVGSVSLVASMGASAVLLFAVPPWPFVSTLAGVWWASGVCHDRSRVYPGNSRYGSGRTCSRRTGDWRHALPAMHASSRWCDGVERCGS